MNTFKLSSFRQHKIVSWPAVHGFYPNPMSESVSAPYDSLVGFKPHIWYWVSEDSFF